MCCQGVDYDLWKWNRSGSVSLVLHRPKLRFTPGVAPNQLSVNENTSAEPVHAVVGNGQSSEIRKPAPAPRMIRARYRRGTASISFLDGFYWLYSETTASYVLRISESDIVVVDAKEE